MKSKLFTLLNLLLLPFTFIFAQYPYPTHFHSNWKMTFPTDVVVNCGNEEAIPPPLIKQQIVNNNGDDFWAMEVKADTFDISGVDGNGACYKIIRNYIFINWDTWNINNTELGIVNRPNDLILSNADRVILRHKSTDLDINLFGDEDDTDPYDEQIGADDDGALIIFEDVSPSDGDLFPRSFIENINGNFVTSVYAENYGYFAYRQIIKVVDHDAPVVSDMPDLSFCDTIGTCSNDAFLRPPVVQECSGYYNVTYRMTDREDGRVFTQGQFLGNPPFSTIFLQDVPLGIYDVQYIVEDGCSNFSDVHYQIEVKDCLAPTTYCINGLAVNLSSDGTAVLWASDFDAGSYDDCSEPISLSFSPDLDSTSLVLGCENVGANIVRLYATDALGNYAYCSTFVMVQPNTTSECDHSAFEPVAGYIETEEGDAVADVKVMSNNLSGVDTMVTDIEGTYIASSFFFGYDYTFSPEKNTNHDNGISIYDLVLLRKHILQTTLLDSPYKIIAADVNRDNVITLGDVIELMKIMLGDQTEFSQNTSWRFVASNYQFPIPHNPWYEVFPEVVNYNNLSEEDYNLDFVGIKVGDLNMSASTNNLTETEERNQVGVVTIETEDLVLQSGKTYRIPFYAKNLSDVAGFQTALHFNPDELTLLNIEEGIISKEYWNEKSGQKGTLPFIFVENQQSDATLFYLNVQAKTNAPLSNLIGLSQSKEHTAAYNQQMEALGMNLIFGDNPSSSTVQLFQNKPNPFSKQTDISFFLAKDSKIVLSVYNTQQQLIFQTQAKLSAGSHVLPFQNDELSNGIYYYTLQVENEVKTKKMAVLK